MLSYKRREGVIRMKKHPWLAAVCAIMMAMGLIGMMIDGLSQFSGGLEGIVGSDKQDETAYENVAYLGEQVANKSDVAFCVTSVENKTTLGSGDFQISTDANYVVLRVKITNDSTDPYAVNNLNFVLLDGIDENSSEYEANSELGILTEYENYMMLDTVNPGLSKEYVLAYETPTASLNANYALCVKNDNLFEEDAIIYLQNR